MTPAAALARTRTLLLAEGFFEVGRGTRGESFYFGLTGAEGQVRIANHARTPRQRRTHPEVVVSLVIAGPLSEGALRERLAATLRDFWARQGMGGVSAGQEGEPVDPDLSRFRPPLPE